MTPTTEEALERRVRLRPDVEWSRFSSGARPTWVARDPVSLDYFYFSRLEQSIARSLDGRLRLRELLERADQPAQRLTPAWLLGLVAKLENACLTVPVEAGQTGQRMWAARNRRQRKQHSQRLLSPLAIRVKLFDPTALLNWLAPVAQLLFSKLFVTLWLVATSLVGLGVLIQLLQAPYSLSHSFQGITAERALALLLIYVVVKSLHELGHALACKKWGAECHEIGLFFLVFTPCLYCNASDSWKLSSRWRRACIAAAGIYVEWTLAAVAGAVWLVTAADSSVHLLAANVMLICSLSTVLVNANPLLRYDGYYVLSDLWGVPNLHEQSKEAMRATATAWLTARRVPRGRWDASPLALTAYGLTAWLYRQMVVFSIAWFVWLMMNRIGFPLLGAMLIGLTLVSVVVTTGIALSQWFKELAMNGLFRTGRLLVLLGLLLAAGLACCYQPWPTFVRSRVVASFAEMTPVYAEHQGVLANCVPPGEMVVQGQQVAELVSSKLELELIDTRGRVNYLEQRTEQLKGRLVDDDDAASELANVIEELMKSRERLKILQREHAALICHASLAGLWIAGQEITRPALTELPDQQRFSLVSSPKNSGCRVDRGTLLGWICQPGAFEVRALVAEPDAERLSLDMGVRCRWDCAVGQRADGRIRWISPEPVTAIPTSLRGDATIPTRVDRHGNLIPLQPHYEVRLELNELPATLGHQSVGTVYFETAPQTWLQSVQDWFNRHLRPEL